MQTISKHTDPFFVCFLFSFRPMEMEIISIVCKMQSLQLKSSARTETHFVMCQIHLHYINFVMCTHMHTHTHTNPKINKDFWFVAILYRHMILYIHNNYFYISPLILHKACPHTFSFAHHPTTYQIKSPLTPLVCLVFVLSETEWGLEHSWGLLLVCQSSSFLLCMERNNDNKK